MTTLEILEEHRSFRAVHDGDLVIDVQCTCGASVKSETHGILDSHNAHVAQVLDEYMQERIGEAVAQAEREAVDMMSAHWAEHGGQ